MALVGIIDDDRGIRSAFERWLGAEGYRTVAFESAEAYLSAGCPRTDCLIVDMNMPGMNGLELTRQLVRMGLDVPVIILTVDAELFYDLAIRAGAVDAIPKTAVGERLLEVVRRILGN